MKTNKDLWKMVEEYSKLPAGAVALERKEEFRREIISFEGDHEFRLVDSIPAGGYLIWNIGYHMPEGYLPLVRVGTGEDRFYVKGENLAVEVKDAQKILYIVGSGLNTTAKMKEAIEMFEKHGGREKEYIDKLKEAYEILLKVPGEENLKG